jgi:protein TonB
MMGTRCAGYAISLAVHAAIAAVILSIPLNMVARQKSIILDFSVVKGRGGGERYASAQGTHKGDVTRNRSSSRTVDAAETRRRERDVEPRAALVQQDQVPDRKSLSHADAQGPAAVTGEGGEAKDAVSTASSGSRGAPGRSGTRTLNYLGSGGADERNFSFIRDKIMQGIVYPDRARRMGWEGMVTLSFTVLENGSIDDVKVVNSSGFPILDENARNTIARTNLKRKVPVRLYVLLPVEYRLR